MINQSLKGPLTQQLAGLILLLIIILVIGVANAAGPKRVMLEPVKISIIIDDLGDKRQAGLRALELPGAVTYAFLPHRPYTKQFAERAHLFGKDVMLHLPMESMESKRLGTGGLTLAMSRKEFLYTVRESLASVPHAIGINNHMGSLLTQHVDQMQWLMTEIDSHNGLFFIDSRTTHHTVAEKVARNNNVAVHRRDVFLDHDPSPAAIAFQFERLIKKAKKRGFAIGIGHPYDSTLTLLEVMLPKLADIGVTLVPVSELFIPKLPEPERRIAKEAEGDTLVYFEGEELSSLEFDAETSLR